MKRRLLSALLAVAMLCALLPATLLTAGADIILPPDPFDDVVSGVCGENVAWELNKTSGVLTISGTGEMTSAPWLDHTGSIRTVTVGDGVTNLVAGAFEHCTRLTTAAISDSVTVIGSSAFSGCAGLTDVTIPEQTVSIGKDAFNSCTKLERIVIPDSVTSIGAWAFYKCAGLTDAVIGGGVTGIGVYTFAYCSALTNVTIPSSVTSIGQAAFFNCTELTDVYYGGIEAKWNKIEIGEMNECLTAARIHCEPCLHTNSRTEHKDPTCLAAGYDRTICNDCGETVAETILPALGHDLVTDAAVAATCTEAGLTAGEHCTRCDYLVAQEVVPALGHDWDEGTITLEPTETEQGEMLFTCKRCGATKTEIIPELSHVHSYTDAVTPPTCTEMGYTLHFCSCGKTYIDTFVAALGHDLVTDDAKPATCTETGLTVGEHCTRCDYRIAQEVVAALGHDLVTDKAKPATCTETGLTAGEHCTRCDYKLAQEVVPALGHTFVDGVCTTCGAQDPTPKPCDGGKDCPCYAFTDVNARDWYHGAADYTVENKLMNGVGGGRFAPNDPMTRAMLVTVLWRYEGSPKAGASDFRDLTADWYKDAVAWAAANGIVNGVGNGRFDPNGSITREQMAAILYRYATQKGFDTSKRGDLGIFPDASRISAYAKEPVAWAVGAGLIGGADGKLMPQGNASRAQVATILMRFIENVVK